MPRSTREWAKRKIDESINNMDWAGTHINKVSERYQADHPEISNNLNHVLTILVMAQDLIKKIGGSF